MAPEIDNPDLTPEPVEIVCADGERLSGHFFATSGSGDALPVLLCPATGVKQQFYFKFAIWLANNGHNALVFDYRGIGLSLHGELKRCKATLSEWGQQDQVAAVDWIVRRTGRDKIVLVGHSAGGQMLGLLPNHHHVARLIGISASTGWFNGMRTAFRLQAELALRCLIPLATKLLGYAPTSLLGLGENLPATVGAQWGQWCAAGGYATNATRDHPEADFHSVIQIPLILFYASDDDIANDKTVDDLCRTFPNADKHKRKIDPSEFGLTSLGHLDWFRTASKAVWPTIAEAINDKQPQ